LIVLAEMNQNPMTLIVDSNHCSLIVIQRFQEAKDVAYILLFHHATEVPSLRGQPQIARGFVESRLNLPVLEAGLANSPHSKLIPRIEIAY
jgi:hypothetical protein